MDVTRNILYDMSTKQLIWHGHVMRMNEDSKLKIAYEWTPARIKIKKADFNMGTEILKLQGTDT